MNEKLSLIPARSFTTVSREIEIKGSLSEIFHIDIFRSRSKSTSESHKDKYSFSVSLTYNGRFFKFYTYYNENIHHHWYLNDKDINIIKKNLIENLSKIEKEIIKQVF